MSRPIKVEDHIYEELDRLKVGRQTFSDVIQELLKARIEMLKALNMLEGTLRFREWQREQRERQETTIR